MASKYLQVTAFLLCTALGSLDIHSCASVLPDLVHFSSSLVLRDSSTTLKDYNVDEYLDVKGERSSLAVEDVRRAETKIYYNQLSLQGYAERKFIVYSPGTQTCRAQAVIDWPLNELRKVSIHMYSLDTLRRDFVDVPIGPSVLMYAVMENAAEFKFITTIFSKWRLQMVDVYGRRMAHMPVDGWRTLDMLVHVPSKTNRNYELSVGTPLSKYLGQAKRAARIVMIGACQVGEAHTTSYSLDKASEAGESILHREVDQLDEESFCDRDHLRFVARYNMVAEHQPGTLLGQSLVELGSEYVFAREPFVQPAGIGCWGSLGGDESLAPKWQRSIAKSTSMAQFSGEFVTTRGSRGLSFVAYDRERHLLRLDRHGRKSVYDLLARRSYHVGEFSSELDTADGLAGSGGGGGGTPKVSKLVEGCVVFDMDVEIGPAGAAEPLTSPMLGGSSMGGASEASPASLIEKLLGLSENDDREHYLGTRTIDHVPYEVFEREWLARADSQVPILLRANKFRPQASAAGDKRLYLTYYVRADHRGDTQADQLLTVKYVELWEFDTRLKRKVIINRLRFVEFSWALDVEPTNDFEGAAAAGHSPTLRLFNLGPCYRPRARQAELVVEFKQAKEKRLAPSQVEIMRQFELEVGEHLVGLLASTIEVSRLNIVDLELDILPTGDLLATNKFVDLYQGLSELYELGRLDMATASSGWRESVRRILHNRHSLEECLLDALAWPEPNRLAFCPLSHSCLIMRRDDLKQYFLSGAQLEDLAASSLSGATAQPNPPGSGYAPPAKAQTTIVCTLYSHRYSTVEEAATFVSHSVAQLADINAWLLNRKTLELDFVVPSGRFTYAATPEVRHVKQLDPIGARLVNGAAALSGLRHTTQDEAPEAVNVNQRVSLAGLAPGDSPFRHCQLACQMDDLCASFSVCERASAASNVCVLSSLRLNAERTVSLAELGARQRGDDQAQKAGAKAGQFELKVTSACESQVFVMQRDEACSLHTRDFLADYRVVRLRMDESLAADGNSSTNQGDETQQSQVSLEECAGACSEMNLFEDPRQIEFTYCPLESQCFIKAAGPPNRATTHLSGRGQCYVYAKRISRAYEVKRAHHLSITRKNQDEAAAAATSKKDPTAPLRLPPELENSDGTALGQAVRRLWGLSEEKCARECNLHKASCLAFDACRHQGRTLCLLYSVRSPLAARGAYLPELKLEQQVREQADLKLEYSLMCEHFHLKAGFFEVRLKQLLDREQQQAGGGGGQTSSKLNEMETLIANEDRELSKRELGSLEEEFQSLANSEKRRRLEQLTRASSSSSWLHALYLVVGLGLGCLAAVYKDYLLTHSSAQMRNLPWFRRQTGGAAHGDLSELVRNDHL